MLAISSHSAFPETLKKWASRSFPKPFRSGSVWLRLASRVVALGLDVPQPRAPESHVGFQRSFPPFAAVGMQCKLLAR